MKPHWRCQKEKARQFFQQRFIWKTYLGRSKQPCDRPSLDFICVATTKTSLSHTNLPILWRWFRALTKLTTFCFTTPLRTKFFRLRILKLGVGRILLQSPIWIIRKRAWWSTPKWLWSLRSSLSIKNEKEDKSITQTIEITITSSVWLTSLLLTEHNVS